MSKLSNLNQARQSTCEMAQTKRISANCSGEPSSETQGQILVGTGQRFDGLTGQLRAIFAPCHGPRHFNYNHRQISLGRLLKKGPIRNALWMVWSLSLVTHVYTVVCIPPSPISMLASPAMNNA